MKRSNRELYVEFAQKMLHHLREAEGHQATIDEWERDAYSKIAPNSPNEEDYDAKKMLTGQPLLDIAVAGRNLSRDKVMMYGIAAQVMKPGP